MVKMMSYITLSVLLFGATIVVWAADPVTVTGRDCPANNSICKDASTDIVTLPGITVEQESPSFIDYDGIVDWLDSPSAMISSGLSIFARNVDEFFADEKLDYQTSGSYIRLTTDMAWYQREPSGFLANVRLRLRLPRSSEKYRFTLESSPDRSKDDLDNNVENDLVNAADNQDYFAGIQADFGGQYRWRYRSGIGVKLRAPPDSFVRLDSWRDFVLNQWGLHIQGSGFWFRHAGRVLNSTVELSRSLSDVLLFRSTSHTHWSEINRYIETSQIFTLYKAINKDRQLSLQTGVYGNTEPVHHATDYRIAMGMRKYLRKRYLYVEFIPQLRYQKIHHFMVERGFIVRLEWVFQG